MRSTRQKDKTGTSARPLVNVRPLLRSRRPVSGRADHRTKVHPLWNRYAGFQGRLQASGTAGGEKQLHGSLQTARWDAVSPDATRPREAREKTRATCSRRDFTTRRRVRPRSVCSTVSDTSTTQTGATTASAPTHLSKRSRVASRNFFPSRRGRGDRQRRSEGARRHGRSHGARWMMRDATSAAGVRGAVDAGRRRRSSGRAGPQASFSAPLITRPTKSHRGPESPVAVRRRLEWPIDASVLHSSHCAPSWDSTR